MTKVKVIGISADDAALKELLEAAECELIDADDDIDAAEDEITDKQDEPVEVAANDDCDDTVVIVVLTPDCPSDEDLEAMVGRAIAKGERVVGMWPRGADVGVIPPCIDKFGDDTITWDPEPLRRVAQGEKPQWQTPTGQPRAEPKTKRNCC